MRYVDVDTIVDIAFQTSTIDTRRMESKRFISPSMSKLEGLTQDVREALARVTTSSQGASFDDDEVRINDTAELGDVDPAGGEEDGGTSTEPEDDDVLTDDDLSDRLTFLAKRVNAFMYLSDEVEKSLNDVLTTTEAELFRHAMELKQRELSALVEAGLFNVQAMRLAIHQFRRADVASFFYTGLNPRPSEGVDSAVTGADEVTG